MTVKEDKCEFGKSKLEYLGHVIGGGELAVPAHRAAAMAEFILPKTKKQLRSFLGAASYYRQFVQGYASMSSVLSPGTSKSAPSVVEWTEEGLEAFNRIKVSLVNICSLTIPSQEDVFTLHTDASGAGIGATLNVTREGKERPAAYFSRQLQGAQHNYSATELEGLAVFKSIHFFAHYLFGTRFTVVTDHKALVSFLKSRVLNKRLHGWGGWCSSCSLTLLLNTGRGERTLMQMPCLGRHGIPKKGIHGDQLLGVKKRTTRGRS